MVTGRGITNMSTTDLKAIIRVLLLERKGNVVVVYHISSNANITEPIRGTYSRAMGKSGLYVAPLGAIKRSWAEFAKRKVRNRGQSIRQSKAMYYGAQNKQEYKNMTLYKLEVPKPVYAQALKAYNARAQSAIETEGEAAMSQWGWDKEMFIPEELLPQVKIIGRETDITKKFEETRSDTKRYNRDQSEYKERSYDGELRTINRRGYFTSANMALSARDESLKFATEPELRKIIKDLEWMLGDGWVEAKIKKYQKNRETLETDYTPDLTRALWREAEKERDETFKEKALLKLQAAKTQLAKLSHS